MKTESGISLKPYNTFGIDAVALKLIMLEEPSDVAAAFDKYPQGLIIGGGSNILLSQPEYDVVLLNRIKGVEVIEETPDNVLISVGAGMNWHQLVVWSLDQDYGGLENLSLIPGTVGAAPIQNIGAYGVELRDVFHGLDYFRFEDYSHKFISNEKCRFGYRDSIFKQEWKEKGFISRIYLRLTRSDHKKEVGYYALRKYLDEKGWADPSIHQISEAVVAIRQSKLPDWHETGNAGSFFKNPVVKRSFYNDLAASYPAAPSFPVDVDHVKIPAAWLIQEAGFKGVRRGPVGTYPLQPLVLVNYGGGTAGDILRLKDEIQAAVRERFGIELVPEVTMV